MSVLLIVIDRIDKSQSPPLTLRKKEKDGQCTSVKARCILTQTAYQNGGGGEDLQPKCNKDDLYILSMD